MGLTLFERFTARLWLVTLHPKFLTMMVITVHKSMSSTLAVGYRTYVPEQPPLPWWKRRLILFSIVVAVSTLSIVFVPLFILYILPQFVLFPIALLLGIPFPSFWWMLLRVIMSILGPFLVVAGPVSVAAAKAGEWGYLEVNGETASGDDGFYLTALMKTGSLLAFSLVWAAQDLTTASALLYGGVAGPWGVLYWLFDARQTCPWRQCFEMRMQQGVMEKLNGYMEFQPALHWILLRASPVECYNMTDPDQLESEGHPVIFTCTLLLLSLIGAGFMYKWGVYA